MPDETATAPSTPAATEAPPAAAPPETQPSTAMDNAQLATQPMQNLQTPDQSIEKMKQDSWGSKVYHGVLSALGGATQTTLARDPQTGKMVATETKAGPGMQWKRIISGALAGLGNAAANEGTGPGSSMRGLGLGIQAGEQLKQRDQIQARQTANEDFEAQQKAATSTAQNALLNHQITASVYNLGRAQVEARFQDAERENSFTTMIHNGGEGTTDLGIFPDFKSVVEATKTMPELHGHQASGNIVGMPHVDAAGKIDGMHYALVTPDWLAQKTTAATPIYQVKPPEKPGGQPTIEKMLAPAGSLTNDQAVKAGASTNTAVLQLYTDTERAKREEEQSRNDARRASAAESEARTRAAVGDSEIKKNEAEADKTRAITSGGGDASVDLIGRGQMDVGKMAYLLSRNPAMANEVSVRYPGFDNSKVGAYANAYKEFTSLKTGTPGQALNAGATVLKHLATLAKLNTVKSHIPGTPDYNAYQNQLSTLVPELGRFYGNDTVPGLAQYRDTLGAQLPGNRQKAIETQAHAMGEKFDSFVQSWRNAAPSAAYQAKMPGIDAEAIAALKELNPSYAESKTAELMNLRAGMEAQQTPAAGAPGQAGPVVMQPGEPTAKGANGETLVVRNGAWVTVQH